jgi:hypothetical protein
MQRFLAITMSCYSTIPPSKEDLMHLKEIETVRISIKDFMQLLSESEISSEPAGKLFLHNYHVIFHVMPFIRIAIYPTIHRFHYHHWLPSPAPIRCEKLLAIIIENDLIVIHLGQVSVPKPTIEDDSTIIGYLKQSSEHLTTVLEIMNNFADVSPLISPLPMQMWIAVFRYTQSSRQLCKHSRAHAK